MSKVMCSALWMWLGASLFAPGALAASLEVGEGTVLIYENVSGEEPAQFIIRVARYHPDIVMEWESVSHQGTVHLFSEAVESADRVTVSGLFEPGIDHEADDTTTKWLARDLYEAVLKGGQVKVMLNNVPAKFTLAREDVATLVVNKQEVQLPVIVFKDSRKGVWTVLKDPENPLLVRYETPYYHESLLRVATGQKNNLRWIRRLPPIK